MTQKIQTFAFVVGEVSPAFFGRLDLQKYPFGLAEVENFFVDYHGGLLNRPGSEFIAMLDPQRHKFASFKTQSYDLTLFFTAGKMRVLRDGNFLPSAAPTTATIDTGVITSPNSLAAGALVYVSSASVSGYFKVTLASGTEFEITSPIGQVVPNGDVSWAPIYELTTPFTGEEVEKMKVTQDKDTLVCTVNTRLPNFIKRISDLNWTLTEFVSTLPTAPTGLGGTASGAGTASVGFAVTAVLDGVESGASGILVTSSIVNYSVTTGHFTVTWSAVPGATRYNVYRSLVYPTAYPTGAQLGYVGYTTGLSFVDQNITPDFTKTLPELANFFAGGNFPSVYARFQQRGVYAGLANEPLDIVGSLANDRTRFSVSFPPIATDSYSYTLDSESERPIKHMLSLRYGLMAFTEDGITQLRGGESAALTATSALAEPQATVSVSDLNPIAINMDVLFMSSLGTELHQMVYTEYTNSFKMQDIMVLSTHLFGPDNLAVQAAWAAEPHKMLHLVREDGQRVVLVYERNLEVYGWSRYRTKGDYLNLQVVREDKHNLVYQTVRRTIKDVEVMFLEREKPRGTKGFDEMWYVDAGLSRPLIRPDFAATLIRTGDEGDEDATWRLEAYDLSWALVNHIIYIGSGMFRVTAVSLGQLDLVLVREPVVNQFYANNRHKAAAGRWGYNFETQELSGLWWLEGETVSVLSDGDAAFNLQVADGKVTLTNPAAYVVAGLGYSARAQTLPLSLTNYVIGGTPLNVRGLALRQLTTRGLAVGSSYDKLEELPARSTEAWDNPLEMATDVTTVDLWGTGDWRLDAQVCFAQDYPLPAGIIGFTFDLDVGE